MLDLGEMPPKGAHPLPEAEHDRLRGWVTRFLKAEGLANAGDPGPVILRRLTNAQYTYTLRDLTGLELDPAREFPTDNAAGEGFTNAGAAMAMSPALLEKYFEAAKGVAEHAVLLPDGFRFSTGTSRRDWTDEAVARLRAFYGRFTDDSEGATVNLQGIVFATNEGGLLPLEHCLAALLEEREAIRGGGRSLEAVAADRGLSPKYLRLLWETLENGRGPSPLLDPLRAAWRSAAAGEAAELAGRVAPWQKALWRFNHIGHIGKVGGPTAWMEPVSPLVGRQEVRVPFPKVGEVEGDEVRLYLAVADAGDGAEHDVAVWERPRIVTPGRPDLPLRDLRDVARRLRAGREQILAHAAACLDAAFEASRRRGGWTSRRSPTATTSRPTCSRPGSTTSASTAGRRPSRPSRSSRARSVTSAGTSSSRVGARPRPPMWWPTPPIRASVFPATCGRAGWPSIRRPGCGSRPAGGARSPARPASPPPCGTPIPNAATG